jgi:formylglycine-generating enzyme required for sulfatase activity
MNIFPTKKKKTTPEIMEVSPVRLKPVFGMAPGLYLSLLYAFLLLTLLFFALVFPGLKKNGSLVSFESTPSASAVYMDGRYLGSTPFTTFVERGTPTFTFKKAFFETAKIEKRIGGRIFASLLFPRRTSIKTGLALEDLPGYLNNRFRQASNWGLAGGFFERYPYPERGSQAAREILTALQSTGDRRIPQELYNFSYMFINNINSKELLEDAFGLFAILEAARRGNAIPNSEKHDISLESLTSLPFSSSVDMDLFKLYLRVLSISDEPISNTAVSALSSRIASLPFRETYESSSSKTPLRVRDHLFVPLGLSGPVPVGNEGLDPESETIDLDGLSSFPHLEEIKAIYMDSSEVSRSQFLRFAEENNRWSRQNMPDLVEEQLVTDEYLSFLDDEGSDMGLPVTHVSWYAAQAYCSWLTDKLPPELKDTYYVRLPSEAEWEATDRLNGRTASVFADTGFTAPRVADYTRSGRLGLVDMRGNVWEWCENWFFPSDVLDGVYGPGLAGFDGVEKSIRGGSWVNSEREIAFWTRASQPPQWCSPFTGFRVVLAPRE